MTPGTLLNELIRLGVRVEADGDRLRYSPRSRVTPELVELLKVHKPELLKTLGRVLYPKAPEQSHAEISAVYVYETLNEAKENISSVDMGSVNKLFRDAWVDGSDEVPDLEPCSKCNSLETWQSAGLKPRWRCVHCDPPMRARRLLERAGGTRHRLLIATTNAG